MTPDPDLIADDVAWVEAVLRMFDEGSEAHRPWHIIVPASVVGPLAWCVDCQRRVLIDGPIAGSTDDA